MATPTDVQAILAALQASTQQSVTPPPSVAPSYNLPQPSSSGPVDLSNIRPVATGNVNFQETLARARAVAAEKGVAYDPNRPPPRQDPRLVGRTQQPAPYQRRSRSRSPPRRDQHFRENQNPYRDERRDDARRGGNAYSRERSRSPPARGRGTFSPQRERGYGGGAGGGRDEENQETIMIESNLVGLVIGRQGENLRRIEAESKTRIQFITGPTESGPERQCRITGPVRARMDAKREIYRIIDENGGSVTAQQAPASRSVSSAGGGGGGGGGGATKKQSSSSSNLPPLREGENSIQIMVPDRTVGLIIGRGGETIRDLQERSGCHINIVGENKSINGLRPVNLIGNDQASRLAKEFILEIVDSDTRNQDQQNASGSRPDTGNEGPPRAKQNYNQDPSKIAEKIYVPSDAVGMIIGKGGETIKDMQATTGCKINVTQASGADVEREIGLIGSREALEEAKAAIWEKVDQVKEKNNGGFGGGSGGRGGNRNNDNSGYGGGGDRNYSQQQPYQQQGQPQGIPPQAGAAAPGGGAEDPYAPYGGYANYVVMWQVAMAQQQGQNGAQPPQGGPPGA
ncbi:hypothetical protein EJ08DRAFT_417501 [Tothia fuscella]|uniref:K Homology domain-containing protein n=1 Tax=Tothia fuscella TaxID=1048955 RepID=A0A9P4TV89_9PEZI|nr:hypothetical protein EJ08DRAFT_417501 [Tothia fuscella]